MLVALFACAPAVAEPGGQAGGEAEAEPAALATPLDPEAAAAAFALAGWPKVATRPTAKFSWPREEFPLTAWRYRSIDTGELRGGGPPRDGIASIDEPRFVTPGTAAAWLTAQEPVAVVDLGGEAKAYPYRILVWHEIVNDVVGGVPVAITYCPLCFSGLAFDRRVDGVLLEFGTSGMLRQSNLVMYDRQTESMFQQINGEAIIGILTGARLERVSMQVLSFAAARAAWPELQVLDAERTGFVRDYGMNPYSRYDAATSFPFMLASDGVHWGDGLLPMARVLVVEEPGGDELPAVGLHDLATAGVAVLPPFLFVSTGTHTSTLDTRDITQGRDVGQGAVYFLPKGAKEWLLEDGVLVGRDGRYDPVTGISFTGGANLAPARHTNHLWVAWSVFKPETAVWAPPA